MNKFQWYFDKNSNTFSHGNLFENVIYNIAAICVDLNVLIQLMCLSDISCIDPLGPVSI